MHSALRTGDVRALTRFLGTAAAVLLASCAAPTPKSSESWPTRADVAPDKAGFTPAGLAALDARMKTAVDKKEVSGLVTLLVRHGEVAEFNSYGLQSFDTGTPMQLNTKFRIFSMTKPITGVAMMQLYEKGLWKLDDPVTKFVPELANLKVHTTVDGKTVLVNARRTATMRELMTHTAGLGYGLNGGNPVDDALRADPPLGKPNMQAMIDAVAKVPLLAQPGERWSYSIGVDIQGLIVSRLSGKSFGDYLRQNILNPLGMNETSFFLEEKDRARFAELYEWNREAGKLQVLPDQADRGYFKADHVESGGGGLVSTAHDYARFLQSLLNKGELDGKRILKPETVALMMQNHIGGELRVFNQRGTGFGLGMAVVHDPAASNSKQGAGTNNWFGIAGTWFWIDPKNDLFFIGMIQRRGGTPPSPVNLRGESNTLTYEALQSTQ